MGIAHGAEALARSGGAGRAVHSELAVFKAQRATGHGNRFALANLAQRVPRGIEAELRRRIQAQGVAVRVAAQAVVGGRAHAALNQVVMQLHAVPRKAQRAAGNAGIALRGVAQVAIGEPPRVLTGAELPVRVEAPHQIAIVRADQHPVPRVVVRRQREQVGALVVLRKMYRLLQPEMHKIVRLKQRVLVAVQIQRQPVHVLLLVVHDLRVAVFPADVPDYAAGHFLKRAPAVRGHGHALLKRLARRGVIQKQRIVPALLQAGQIAHVLNRAAGIHRIARLGIQRDGQMLPVNEVAAAGVPPVHVAPAVVVRVVLIKQVIPALVQNQSVRVVDPTLLRGKVSHARFPPFRLSRGIF